MKVCDHVTRSCTCTDSCLFSHILLLAIILHVYYTPIPTTLFISTDNLLVLLEDVHESQSSIRAVVKTQVLEISPKSDIPQNNNSTDNSSSLSQPQSIRQDILGSLTPDKEQSSSVQTGADKGLFMHAFFELNYFKVISCLPISVFLSTICTVFMHAPCNYAVSTILFMSTDTLPNLLDDVHESKGCTEPVVRAHCEAPESDVPQEDEDPGSEPQLNQKCTYKN